MINRIIQAILLAVFRFLARGRRPRLQPGTIRNVLLVSTTGLGDTVISTAAFTLARQAWPEAKLFALLHQRWAGLVSADPRLNGVIEYPGKFKKMRQILRRLKTLDLDIVILLHANDPDIVPLCWLAHSRYLVGSDRTIFNFLLDLPVSNPDMDRHISERRMDLVRAVSGPLSPTGPIIFLSEEVRNWAQSFWIAQGVHPDTCLIALNPGGSRQPKRWPDEHWVELIRRLKPWTNIRIVLFGSPAEKVRLENLAHRSGDQTSLIICREKIIEAAALLPRVAAFIGP
ncbi:MAG: glycosyltransferase family 9 protein, partial [Deltaproteobacteria bacterium]|nr:glycosyltransferase family 9 protein [Deltaproteobacteria bacterium]